MSSEKRIYLGGYIELPENALDQQWDDIADDLQIHVDEFVRVAHNSPILISNFVNFVKDDEEVKILTLNPSIIKYLNIQFDEKHGESIKKFQKHFKSTFEIKVGFISYYW